MKKILAFYLFANLTVAHSFSFNFRIFQRGSIKGIGGVITYTDRELAAAVVTVLIKVGMADQELSLFDIKINL